MLHSNSHPHREDTPATFDLFSGKLLAKNSVHECEMCNNTNNNRQQCMKRNSAKSQPFQINEHFNGILYRFSSIVSIVSFGSVVETNHYASI